MRPCILVISLLVTAVLAGLGATGVLLSAQADEQRRRATAQGVVLDVAAAIQTQLLQLQAPLLAVTVMVQQNPYVPTALKLFDSYAQELLDSMQAQKGKPLLVDIRLSPQGVIRSVVPRNSSVGGRTLGFDLLADPVRREGVMYAIRSGGLTVKGPALLQPEGISGLIVGLPIFIYNVTNPNETFGAVAPATNCSICYDAPAKRRFWGVSATVVDLQRLIGTSLPGAPPARPAATAGAGAGAAAAAGGPAVEEQAGGDQMLLSGLGARGFHYALLAPQRDGPPVRISNAPPGGLAAPVTAALDMPGMPLWTLLVQPAAGWAPAWRDGLLALVLCLAALVGELVLGLLVKRAEQDWLLSEIKDTNAALEDEKGRTRALLGRQMNLIQMLIERGPRGAVAGAAADGGGAPRSGGAGSSGATGQAPCDAPRSAREKIEDLRRAVGALPEDAAGSGSGGVDEVVLQDPLGEGAFGKVYRGLWRGTQVAVKSIVLPARMSGAAKRERMAIMEAAISSAMAHPNIVQTYTYTIKHVLPPAMRTVSNLSGQPPPPAALAGEPCGAPAAGGAADEVHPCANFEVLLVLELCDMGTLRDALDARAFHLPLDAPGPNGDGVNYAAVLDTAADVARAMLHLHRQSVLHSDLKARNVLLKSNGGSGRGVVAKVADFGLSMHMDAAATHMSYCQGTLTHMAPETLLYHRVSKAGDMFAFGILLYELYTGARVHADTPLALLGHKVSVEGLRPSFLKGAPAEYVALAQACWAQDPAERPTFDSALASLTSMRAALGGRTPVLQALRPATSDGGGFRAHRAPFPRIAAQPGANRRDADSGSDGASGSGDVRLVVQEPWSGPCAEAGLSCNDRPRSPTRAGAPLSAYFQAFSIAASFNTRVAKRRAAAAARAAADADTAPPAADPAPADAGVAAAAADAGAGAGAGAPATA